ncbi:hypothetical protein EDB86DRAFT_2831387 [Lactarius hatsudake]|nr:hypothetical protein EDB86DRAFT_2831387 [Lactarius hatsudake]
MACSAPSFALFTCIGGGQGLHWRQKCSLRTFSNVPYTYNRKASEILVDGVHFPTLGRDHHVQGFFFDYESKKGSGVRYYRRGDTYLMNDKTSWERYPWKSRPSEGFGQRGSVVEDDRFGAPEDTNRASEFG